jgi:hypothetical protein
LVGSGEGESEEAFTMRLVAFGAKRNFPYLAITFF